MEHFLAERGLELSYEETRITRLDDGFDFLFFGREVWAERAQILAALECVDQVLLFDDLVPTRLLEQIQTREAWILARSCPRARPPLNCH